MDNDPLSELKLILRIISYQIESKQYLDIDELDEILHLLSNRTRRRMLAELASGEGFVNELVKKLNDHPQSIIRHLEVLKKHKLIIGQERQGPGRGRPRLYYSLFPDVADIISGGDKSSSKLAARSNCSSFPRLNTIRNQLRGRISHSEQKRIISEVESIKHEHETALKVCNEILNTVKKKVTKIPIE
jgi:predicted transcriptional regulator